MSKLEGTSSLSRRRQKKKEQQEIDQPKDRITTVATKRNVTTGAKPVSIRLSENNQADLNLWLQNLELEMGKKVTAAKLIRGIIHMRDNIDKEDLINAINAAN
jgi:uncharacterized protein YxjI